MVDNEDTGGGTLNDFHIRCTELRTTKGRNLFATQIFPITDTNGTVTSEEGNQGIYEWIIHYHDDDNAAKLFEKETGKVKIDMTDEDRKEAREEKKPVEVVI